VISAALMALGKSCLFKHQEYRIAQLVFVQHAVKLIARLGHAVAIVAIHDKDQTLSVLEVVTPERSNLCTTRIKNTRTHVPRQSTARTNRKYRQPTDENRRAVPNTRPPSTSSTAPSRTEARRSQVFTRTLSCPPTSHTVKEIFLYSTVSTLKPTHIHVRQSINRAQRHDGDPPANTKKRVRASTNRIEFAHLARTDGGNRRDDFTQL